MIASRTASICNRTSWFQKRITFQPSSSSRAVLPASRVWNVCEPSSSITKRRSRQQKSATKGGMGCWRRNLSSGSADREFEPTVSFRVSQFASQRLALANVSVRQWWLDPCRHVDFPPSLNCPPPGVVRAGLTTSTLAGTRRSVPSPQPSPEGRGSKSATARRGVSGRARSIRTGPGNCLRRNPGCPCAG